MKLHLSPDTDLDAINQLETDLLDSLRTAEMKRETSDMRCLVDGLDELGVCIEMSYKVTGNMPTAEFKALNGQVYVALWRCLS